MGLIHRDPPELDELAALPALSGLSRQDLRLVIKRAQRVSVPAGWPLLGEGTPGDAAYLIIEGSARILVAGKPVAEVRAGDIVGEAALLQGRLRNATVAADTAMDLMRWDSESFEAALKDVPALREHVAAVAAAHQAPAADGP